MKRVVLIVAVLSAMILAGCSPVADNYLKAIPDNPVAMLKVNVGNLLDESEILENPIVKPLISSSANQLPQGMTGLFNEIVAEPEASGLDFDMPAVLAVVSAKPMNVVITLPVADKSRLEKMLQCFSDGDVEITTEGGVSRVNTYSNEFDVAYDDTKFVVALAETGANVMEYMNLQTGAVDNAEYKQFFSAADDAALYASGAELYDFVASAPYFMYNVRHADDIEIMKEMSILITLNFENGYAELALDCDYPQELKDKFGSYLASSTKEHLKYIPEDAFFVVDFGIDTETAIENMSDEERTGLESSLALLGLDASSLASMSGDVTFAVSSADNMPLIMAVFDCNDQAVFNSITSLLEFILPRNGYNVAHLDNKIFILPSQIFNMVKSGAGVVSLDSNALDNALVSSMGNAALLDCDKLVSALGDDFDMGEYGSLVSSLESVRLQVESPTRVVLRVTTKDKNTNILKIALDKAIELSLRMR